MQLVTNTFLPLWTSPAPGALGDGPEDTPGIEVILPAAGKASGASVIVCPGGGYAVLAPHEAIPVGEWLASFGVTAFVLRYRLGPRYRYPIALGDAQRALQLVRAQANAWGLDPARIGILGFSAGGHLASMTATRFSLGDPEATDPLARVSSRPDLHILIYPVINMDLNYPSISSLLAYDKHPSQALMHELSTNEHIQPTTPPAFLVHSTRDEILVENSDLYAASLAAADVPYEYVRGDLGPHGFGLKDFWTKPCETWLQSLGFW